MSCRNSGIQLPPLRVTFVRELRMNCCRMLFKLTLGFRKLGFENWVSKKRLIMFGGSLERLVLVIAILLLAYTWAGYPMILLLLRSCFARRIARAPHQYHPRISIIVAVRNEEEKIVGELMD